MNSVTSTIENGFVHLPEKAAWLGEYVHELSVFPNGRFDDQADSTSQPLDWFKISSTEAVYGQLEYQRSDAERERLEAQSSKLPASMPCSGCGGVMAQRVSGGLRCAQCGAQWYPQKPTPVQFSRKDILNGNLISGRRWRFR